MSADPRVFFQGNTIIAELTELRDEVTNILLPAASCSAWLVDQAGATVPDSTIPLNKVVDGHYQGLFPYTLILTPHVPYQCMFRADTGNPVQRGEWTIPVIPGPRYA